MYICPSILPLILYHAPGPKVVMHPQITTNPSPCFTISHAAQCWGPMHSQSPTQHDDLPFESIIFIFVSSLKITSFQSLMIQFPYLWANLKHLRTCLRLIIVFLCYTCAPNLAFLKTYITVMSDNKSPISNKICFVVAYAVPSWSSVTRVTQRSFFPFTKALDVVLFVSQSRPLHPPSNAQRKIASYPLQRQLWIVNCAPLLSCTKAWCLHSWDNQGIRLQMILQNAPHVLWNQGYIIHKISYNVLNYTMHTHMLMLEKWRRTKMSIVTLTTSTFPILETLIPFIFSVLHLCNWLLGLVLWWLYHFVCDLNQLTVGAEVEFVYNVLNFVRNSLLEYKITKTRLPAKNPLFSMKWRRAFIRTLIARHYTTLWLNSNSTLSIW